MRCPQLLVLLCLACGALPAAEGSLISELLAADRLARLELLQTHFAATSLQIPAGRLRLQEALEPLRAEAGQVLLQVGLQGDAELDFAGASGDFWQVALKLADAFDLQVAPAPSQQEQPTMGWPRHQQADPAQQRQQELFGGPLRLRRGRATPGSLHPAGSLLLEITELQHTRVRSLNRDINSVDLRYRLRVQPGRRFDLIEAALIRWHSAVTDQGHSLSILTDGENDILLQSLRDGAVPQPQPDQRHHYRSVPPQLPLTQKIRLDALPAGCRSISLAGEALLSAQMRLDLRCSLRPGEAVTVEDSPVPLRCRLLPTAPDEAIGDGITHKLIVSFGGNGLAGAPQVNIYTETGENLRRMQQRREGNDYICYLPPGAGAGLYHVQIYDVIDLGIVRLPLAAKIALP